MSIPDQVLLNMLISILFFFREVCWAGKNQNNTDKRTVIELEHFEHHMKSVRIRSLSGPYFTAFKVNMERYGVSIRIQFECGKVRASKTPNTDTFNAVFRCNTEQ